MTSKKEKSEWKMSSVWIKTIDTGIFKQIGDINNKQIPINSALIDAILILMIRY